MRIEHFAINVSDPLGMGRWYVRHLGFTVKRRTVDPPYIHFLADDSGQVMIEIYGNEAADVANFEAMHPLSLHLALVSQDVDKDVERLVAAGARLHGEIATSAAGDRMAMVKDPWGFTLQLVQRQKPMV